MRQVLEAPVTKSIVLAGILLAAGLIYARTTHHRDHHQHRLALHTTARPHAIYFSAWGDGDGHNGVVNIKTGDSGLRPITFNTRASVSAGGSAPRRSFRSTTARSRTRTKRRSSRAMPTPFPRSRRRERVTSPSKIE